MRTDATAYVEFWVLAGAILLWIVLNYLVLRRLRIRHPQTYEALGSPRLLWNNNMMFMKFMFVGGWRQLGDPALERTLSFMRIFVILYLVYFAYLIFGR